MSITTVLGNAFGVFIFQTGIAPLTIKELTFIVVNLKQRSNEMTREDIFKLLNKHQDNDTLDIKTAKEMVNIIFDEHEVQLKAKYEEIEKLTEELRLRKLIMCLLGSIQLYKIKGKQDDTRKSKTDI